MAGRWFRFYADAMRHPKVASLPDKTFRLWVELLCVASENEGNIPSADTLKHVLKRRLDHLLTGLEGLLRAELIDRLDDGYRIHGWAKRQYKSDSSTARVREHRAKRNVPETPPDTETDTETEKDGGLAFRGKVIRLRQSDFDAWGRSFPDLDLAARLQARDDWLATKPSDVRSKWFLSTSSWLAAQQQAARREARQESAFTGFC